MRGRAAFASGFFLLLSFNAFAQADRGPDVAMKRAPVEGGQLE